MSNSINPEDTFFSENSPEQWTFAKFHAHYLKYNPEANIQQIVNQYHNCLNNIRKECNDRELKVKIGKLLKDEENFKPKKNVPINIENHGDGMVVGLNYGTVIQNVVNHSNKRQKTDHTAESAIWKIDDEEDLWDAWRQYLETCTCHEFCLEKYHVIECGYSIKCNYDARRPLQDHIITDYQVLKSPFQSCPDLTFAASDILRNMTEGNWREARRQLFKIQATDSPESTFAVDWFLNCHRMFKNADLHDFLSKGNENSFQHYVIWPMMDMSIDVSNTKMELKLAEYILKASQEEYKADACILDEYTNEICLLETSSTFLYKESGKLGYDHVKGTFGALMLFNGLFKRYRHATLETAQNLTVLFIHARDNSLHLWSLELCSEKVYALKKVYKAQVPTDQSDTKNILALGNFAWCIKECLKKSCKLIRQMKEEHDNAEVRKLMGEVVRSDLSQMVDTEIKKPVKGAGYGILLPEEKEEEEVDIRFTP